MMEDLSLCTITQLDVLNERVSKELYVLAEQLPILNETICDAEQKVMEARLHSSPGAVAVRQAEVDKFLWVRTTCEQYLMVKVAELNAIVDAYPPGQRPQDRKKQQC